MAKPQVTHWFAGLRCEKCNIKLYSNGRELYCPNCGRVAVDISAVKSNTEKDISCNTDGCTMDMAEEEV